MVDSLTTKERQLANVAAIENKLNQTTPPTDKSFNRVMSSVMAMSDAGIRKFSADQVRENLATDASLEGLKAIGTPRGIIFKEAQKCQAEIMIAWAPYDENWSPIGVILYVTDDQSTEYQVTGLSPTPTMQGWPAVYIEALNGGEDFGVSVGTRMTVRGDTRGDRSAILVWPSGVRRVVQLALNEETTEAYRRRVLNALPAISGGGNSYDLRRWAEETPGVCAASVFSGGPSWTKVEDVPVTIYSGESDAFLTMGLCQIYSSVSDFSALNLIPGSYVKVEGTVNNNGVFRVMSSDHYSIFIFSTNPAEVAPLATVSNAVIPGFKTVFIEAALSDEVSSKIPSQDLLDAAFSNIVTDPSTGLRRFASGDIDEDLFVVPVIAISPTIRFEGVTVSAALMEALRDDVQEELDKYLLDFRAFVIGLDRDMDRKDVINIARLNMTAASIFEAYGATYSHLSFLVDSVSRNSYKLGRGEVFGSVAIQGLA